MMRRTRIPAMVITLALALFAAVIASHAQAPPPGASAGTASVPAGDSAAATPAVGPGAARLASEAPVPVAHPEELDAARLASGRCGVCHPRERTDFARGLHAHEGVRCVSCHHGSDAQMEAAAAHAGMIARPAPAAIADLCGSCHSDPQKMGPYAVPVDQVALYRTSEHGRLAAQNDRGTATCVDCHGAHESLPASDPRSATYRSNVDLVCARCHGGRTATGAKARDVMAEWRASVHGRPHAIAHATGTPGCTGCHGVHGAAPPAAGDVGKVCGQCHGRERRYVASGGHAQTQDHLDRPECAACHGTHAIREARPDSLATSCAGCHRPGTREEALGKAMWDEYRSAQRSIDAAAALVAKADQIPVPTEDYHARLEDARSSLAAVLPASHAVLLEPVHEAAQQARAAGDEVRESVQHELGLVSERWLMLVVFWLFAGLLLVVLHRWRRPGNTP